MNRAMQSGPLVSGVILAAVTLMAAGTWWLLRDSPPAEPALPAVAGPAPQEEETPAPVLDRRPEPVMARPQGPLVELTVDEARAHARSGRVEVFGVIRHGTAPVVSATVWLDGVAQAVSDEQGRYRFVAPFVAATWEDQRPRGPALVAWHDTRGCAVVECPPRGGRVDLDLAQGPQGILTVHVVDRETGRSMGRSAVEIHVYPYLEDLPLQKGFTLERHTDGLGHLVLEQLPPGKVALRARAQKYGMLRFEQRHARAGQYGAVTLALTRAQTVLGRFSPWPPPFVSAEEPVTLGVNLPELRLLDHRLAADGRFSLDILRPAAELTLHLSQESTILWHHVVESLPFDDLTDLGVIPILPAPRVRGTLGLDPRWIEHGLEVHLQFLTGSQARRVLTLQKDGSFDSGPVPTGLFTVGLLFHEQVLALERAQVSAGEVHVVGPWTLPRGVWGGRVQDTNGRGVALPMNLFTEPDEQGKRRDLGQWRSDAEGWFVGRIHDLTPATATVELRDVDDQLLATTPLSLEQPQASPLFLVIPPPPTLHGMLVDGEGRALADWSVTLHTASGRRFTDLTAKDGSFSLIGAGAGPWTAVLTAPTGSAYELPVAAGSGRRTLRLDQAQPRRP